MILRLQDSLLERTRFLKMSTRQSSNFAKASPKIQVKIIEIYGLRIRQQMYNNDSAEESIGRYNYFVYEYFQIQVKDRLMKAQIKCRIEPDFKHGYIAIYQ